MAEVKWSARRISDGVLVDVTGDTEGAVQGAPFPNPIEGGVGGGGVTVDNQSDPPAEVTTLIAPGATIAGDEATFQPAVTIDVANIPWQANHAYVSGDLTRFSDNTSVVVKTFDTGTSGAVEPISPSAFDSWNDGSVDNDLTWYYYGADSSLPLSVLPLNLGDLAIGYSVAFVDPATGTAEQIINALIAAQIMAPE